MALLQELANSRFDEPVVGFNQLRARMLAIAWVPIVQHRLSLGSQDQVDTVLRTISPGMHLVNAPSLSELRERVQQPDAVDLLRYVPELLIRPFFDDTLPPGVVTSKVQSRIRDLAHETFATQRPLYLITEDRSAVVVHAEWLAYLRDNFGIVRGWALWQWLDYLQRRNPNVPNVAAKLGMNKQRQSLQAKRHYWDRVMAIGGHQEFTCIYTGASIDTTDYDLDHFVPWAFVSHDQLWNLTPVIPAANRSKSDSVPSEEYLPLLAQMHHKAFTIAARELPKRYFGMIVEE